MLTRKRLPVILVAVLTAGVVLALTLSSAAAGPSGLANRLFLPLVELAATQTPTPTDAPTVAAPTSTPTATEAPTETAMPTATSAPTTAGPTQQPANCDHSYPTICIPYPPPDLNCPDIPYRNFQVVAPDDHHFDSDHDGIGCEL